MLSGAAAGDGHIGWGRLYPLRVHLVCSLECRSIAARRRLVEDPAGPQQRLLHVLGRPRLLVRWGFIQRRCQIVVRMITYVEMVRPQVCLDRWVHVAAGVCMVFVVVLLVHDRGHDPF